MKMRINFRSSLLGVAAILAGIGVNITLSIGLDTLFRGAGVLPPAGEPMSEALHVLPFTYRLAIAVLGFYVVAKLAPTRPLVHALLLAAIAFSLTLTTTIASWNAIQSVEPQWFQLAMLVLLFPMAWLGAWMAGRKSLSLGKESGSIGTADD